MLKLLLIGSLCIAGCSNLELASSACPGERPNLHQPRSAMTLDSYKQCDVVLNSNKSALITNPERKVHR